MNDLSYLQNTSEEVPVPFTVQGVCAGTAALLQQLITLAMSDESGAGRQPGGGGLAAALTQGFNVRAGSDARLRNALTLALSNAVGAVKQSQNSLESMGLRVFADGERLVAARVESVTVLGDDSFSAQISITTVAGSETASVVV